VQSTRAVPVETLGAGFTPVATNDIGVTTPTVSGTANGTGTAVSNGTTTPQSSASPSSTASSTSGTSTVTNTPPPGATLTPTPLATASSGGSSVNTKGDIFITDFVMADLEASTIHEWTMPLDADEGVVVAVVGELDMDMGIKIYDENLTELASQDTESVGQMESVTLNTTRAGDFKVRISEKSGIAGGYLLALGAEDFFYLYPQGNLVYGTGDSAMIYWDETHYWFFEGVEDDVIDVAISCNNNADLGIYLLDQDMNEVIIPVNPGDLEGIVLPETGWYIFEIDILDFEEDSCTYNIIITEQ
jgi:hypothetical protein